MVTIFIIAIFIMSVVIHEVSHGMAALWQGDPTAKYMDRLSLNPLKHIDIFGSIIVPIIFFISKGFPFGWAKPVPYNPYNLRDQKYGPAIVGVAGPLANISIALIFGIFLKILLVAGKVSLSGTDPFFEIFSWAITLNIILAVFNLIPFPPLDGSKLLFALVPISEEIKIQLEQYGFMVLIFIIFLFPALFYPVSVLISSVISLFFKFVVGISVGSML